MDEGGFVDARGLSCPQPVMMTREALMNAEGGTVRLRTDTATQVQNCTRVGRKLGWEVSVTEHEGYYELSFSRQP